MIKKELEGQRAKDSHNSSLPPSSDRFVRPAKGLRKKSGKKAGGQPGHHGHHLQRVAAPDEILLHPVERCEVSQCDLHDVPAKIAQRRQLLNLPALRLWVSCAPIGREPCFPPTSMLRPNMARVSKRWRCIWWKGK